MHLHAVAFFLDCLILEEGTNMLPQNVGNKISTKTKPRKMNISVSQTVKEFPTFIELKPLLTSFQDPDISPCTEPDTANSCPPISLL